jgi:hypothetical protein
MPDWNTRLAVSYEASDGTSGEISPIDSFSPSFALSAKCSTRSRRRTSESCSTRRT